jgi:hypothetical protein
MKKFLIALLLLIPINAYAVLGSLSGTVKDWLGSTMTTETVYVYVFALTGSGVSTQLADQTYIASTTSRNGTWIINNDADIVSGTEYFVVYFYGGSHTGLDGKTKTGLMSTLFLTATDSDNTSTTTTTINNCGNFEVCSTFSNLDDFFPLTQLFPGFSASGTLSVVESVDRWILHLIPLANSYRQYAKVKIDTYTGSGDYPWMGLVFRSGFPGTYKYIMWFGKGDKMSWSSAIGNRVVGNISANNTLSSYATGNWIGAEVENTGNNTVVRAWRWTSDPGDRGSWGTAGLTLTTDPGTSAADSQKYVGVGMGNISASLTSRLDNFYAGSSASAP